MYNSQNIQIALSRIQDEKISNKENRNGFYRAIVVQNTDPWNLGRIRIRIPSFHGVNEEQIYYIPDDRLPYAYPATMNAASNKSGSYLLPIVGSIVWVSFEAGTDNIIYFGGVYCAEPTGSRYLYFDRTTNNGQPIQITEDDIPSDYNANRYILFRSPKGSIIEVDDRDKIEKIQFTDSHGNKIIMNANGVTINTEATLAANFPYLHNVYISKADISADPILTVKTEKLFADVDLQEPASPAVGNAVLYIRGGACVGSGIVIQVSPDGSKTTISNFGVGDEATITDTFEKELAKKVDKETGKGLSSNDFTDKEKETLSHLYTEGNGSLFLANDGTYKTVPQGTLKEVLVNGESVVEGDTAKIDLSAYALIETVNQQISDLNDSFDLFKEDMSTQIEDALTAIDTAKKELETSIQEQFDTLSASVDEQIKIFDARLGTLEKYVDEKDQALQDQIDDINKNVDDKLASFEENLDTRFNTFETDMDKKFDDLNKSLEDILVGITNEEIDEMLGIKE